MSKKKLSKGQQAQLEELAAMADSDIDTADIPEASAESWLHARRGHLYRPLKQSVTIRLDADVIAWFKDHAGGRGYQTEINGILRRHVIEQEKHRS